MNLVSDAMPIDELAPDIKAVLRLTRWLPGLQVMPVPLARIVYTGAALFFNPVTLKLARWRRHGYRLSLYQPPAVNPTAGVHFFIHGGGWALGSTRSYRAYCRWVASRLQAPVYALDYRRAPEHPYPAALDDSVRAYRELRAQLPVDCPIHVIGDSAGAQLALGLCYRLRDLGEAQPKTLRLYYPVVETPGRTLSYTTFGKGLFLSSAMMHWFWRMYQPPEDDRDHFPLRWSSHDWLPPVTLCLARHDVLFDEGVRLASILRRAGVLQDLYIERDLPHGYLNLMRCPTAMAALNRSLQKDASI